MLVARSLSCSIRDVQCTSQAHTLLTRTDRDVCVCQTLCSIQTAHGCMAQDYSALCSAQKFFMSSTRHLCLRMSVPLHLRLSLLHHQPLRSRCRSINTATNHRMRSMALWPKQPLLQCVYTSRRTYSSCYCVGATFYCLVGTNPHFQKTQTKNHHSMTILREHSQTSFKVHFDLSHQDLVH